MNLSDSSQPGEDLRPHREEEIHRALVDELFEAAPATLASSFAAACLFAYVLWASAAPDGLLVWYLATVVVTAARFVYVRHVRSRDITVATARRDELSFAGGSLLAGVVWGCSVALAMQVAPSTELLVVPCTMAALSTSAIVSYSRSPLSFAAFVVPSFGAYAVRMVWLEGQFEPAMAGFVLFWSALLIVFARNQRRGSCNRIELAMNNSELIANLTEARDRADSANLAKTRFLANMSHELRTPLNAILGYSEMMAKRTLGSQDFGNYDGYPPIVVRSGRHLLDIVNQVLDVSKLEAGAVDLSDDLIDVSNLIESSVKFVIPDAERDGVIIDWKSPDQLPYLRGDATKVRQIVLNLLSNAVKFTPRDGTVRVRARNTAEGRMDIIVEDSGIGISPEDMKNALVPFARMESQEHLRRMRDLDSGGERPRTGLGLPLVNLLTELHGGNFHLSSRPGVGTVARVSFPATRVQLNGNVTSLRAVS